MCALDGVIITFDDPSPADVGGLSDGVYIYTDPCPCVEAGHCPRCGSVLVGEVNGYGKDSTLRCPDPECGWEWVFAADYAVAAGGIEYDEP